MADQLEEGPTEVSGVQGEAECPSDHWPESDTVKNSCTSCGAQV